jgi:hypothetical protein
MKWRHLFGVCFGLAAIMAGLLAIGTLRNQAMLPGVVDPAVEFYTKTHSNGYAAIDRWAQYGMRAERMIDILRKAGYECESPSELQYITEPGVLHDIQCSKTEQWPLSRTLTIEAKIEQGIVNRLVAANAHSKLTHADQWFAKEAAALLRKLGWIEPETLKVTGFQIDSIETLSRMVADTLAPNGWQERCTDEQADLQCSMLTNDRLKTGYPPLPQTALAAGTALQLERAFERIRFMPRYKRGADNKAEDSLLIHLIDGRMWLDFASKDLTGHELAASVELESKGGTPDKLIISLDGESRTFALAGRPRRANNGSVVYLFPEAPLATAQDTRYTLWVNLPNRSLPASFDQLAQKLPLIDMAFIGPMARAIVGDIATDTHPEEILELYPPLHQIEHKAEAIRATHPESWMPRAYGNRLIAEAYPDNPAVRAAWAFATCESNGKPSGIDGNCMLRFVTADPDAAMLVRHEIARLRLLYGDLPENHPIRIRLNRLNEAFSTEHDDKSNTTGK